MGRSPRKGLHRRIFAMKKYLTSIAVLFSMGLSLCAWAGDNDSVDKPAEYFFYRCAGCHTVGGGKLSGPDLLPSTKWEDVDLKSAIKKMEKNVGPISDVELNDLTAFLKSLNVSTRIAQQKEKVEAKLRASLPPASFDEGRKLFTGQKPLANGGPACYSCHLYKNAGGSLGFDLTAVKEKLAPVALQSAIENSSYKIMRPIYEKHPVTKEESLHLAEYLSHPEKVDGRPGPGIETITALASALSAVFFVILYVFNRGRKGSTRDKLFNRKS